MKYFTIKYNYEKDNKIINLMMTTLSETIEDSYNIMINHLSSKLTNIKDELTFNNFKLNTKVKEVKTNINNNSIINMRLNINYIDNDILNFRYESYY